MKAKKLPILNDPIYGFIRIESPLVFELLEHPYFQRLRRISQMGLSSLVYPSARHSRFEHALGSMHLMTIAMATLKQKGIDFSDQEEEALCIAILLHDIGHGPFSHAMEHSIFTNTPHEQLSLGFMHLLNDHFDGKLTLAIQIYSNRYPRKFMHQLVSSQLDMDRLDYLRRDSFFTGATEGNINTQRLIAMLHVRNDQLVIEENGLYSVEKFIMARRMMYWQVYLHKTGLAAELLLTKLMQQVRDLTDKNISIAIPQPLAYFFDNHKLDVNSKEVLHQFSRLDDTDIISVLKLWQDHDDEIVSSLAKRILYRRLMKIKIQHQPFTNAQLLKKKKKLINKGLSQYYADNFVFTDQVSCQIYSPKKDPIFILTKSGEIKPLDQVSPLFKNQKFYLEEIKYYLCYSKAK